MAHLTSLCDATAKLHGDYAAASRERMRVLHFLLRLHRFYAIIYVKVGDDMKKKIFIILASCILIVVVSICIFKYYHPTHFAYNDRFIIGNTQEKIIEKYGEFYSTQKNSDGEITRGTYMIRDNTPELIMSYDDSLWYEIYFENGKAVEVKLREGYIGG